MSDKETLAAARAPNLGAPTYMASAPEERAAKPHSTFPAGASSSSWIGEGVDAKEKKLEFFSVSKVSGISQPRYNVGVIVKLGVHRCYPNSCVSIRIYGVS